MIKGLERMVFSFGHVFWGIERRMRENGPIKMMNDEMPNDLYVEARRPRRAVLSVVVSRLVVRFGGDWWLGDWWWSAWINAINAKAGGKADR